MYTWIWLTGASQALQDLFTSSSRLNLGTILFAVGLLASGQSSTITGTCLSASYLRSTQSALVHDPTQNQMNNHCVREDRHVQRSVRHGGFAEPQSPELRAPRPDS